MDHRPAGRVVAIQSRNHRRTGDSDAGNRTRHRLAATGTERSAPVDAARRTPTRKVGNRRRHMRPQPEPRSASHWTTFRR